MWKLVCERGRQVWEYAKGPSVQGGTPDDFSFDYAKNRNSGDLVYRTQMLAKNYKEQAFPKDVKLPADPVAASALQSAHKGINFYQALQDPDGHWPGDYGGPMFLMPGFVIACYVTGTEIAPERRKEMIRYLTNHQQSDGGWGTHIEGESTVFGTALNYCAFRILGVDKEDPRAKRASAFLKKEGGAVMSPSWGKFYLCVLGVFEWEGVNSLFPELWLTPYFLPVYPGRYWCHCRMVYLPMAYCYGTKFTGPLTPLVMSLREEIHAQPYNTIKWSSVRDSVAPRDRYFYPSWAVQLLFVLTNAYEKVHSSWLRKKAVKWIGEYIDAEDQQTLYIDIGPVNKVINFMCVYQSHGPKSPQFKKHVDRLWDYLWLAEDGMKMQGYNGSQLWDTAFATQAIIETGLGPRFSECLTKAYKYLECTQTIEETPQREKWFRHIAKGAWPFSTRDHGWPISDCTSEGIKATLALHQLNAADGSLVIPSKGRISDERMHDAINVVLSFQNGDGGWATYENTRGSAYLELINPSEVFGEIMIDYSHTECTAACIQSLLRFKAAYPTHRTDEINRAVKNGLKFLKYKQRPEGNWYGFWGVCFTYGTWFAVEAFVAAGETVKTCPELKRGIDWLISAQLEDGGWGESYKSCVIKKYVPHTHSQIVNTSWALLALMAADYPDQRVIKKGVQVLLSRQKANGDWDQEGISGVFNGNCMITYTAYRNVFPIWALGRYVQKYGSLPQQNGKH